MTSPLFAAFSIAAWMGAAPDTQAEARALVESAVKAHGGAEKVHGFRAARWTGEGEIQLLVVKVPMTVEWHIQMPDRMRVSMEMTAKDQKLSFLRIFAGNKGWTSTGTAMEMTDDEVKETAEQMYANWVGMLTPLNKPEFKFAMLPERKVFDRPALGVRISHKDRRDIDLWFDKETRLRVRSEYKVKDDITGFDVQQESLYADYKEYAGVKHPTRLTINRGGRKFLEVKLKSFEALDKVDDALFSEPSM